MIESPRRPSERVALFSEASGSPPSSGQGGNYSTTARLHSVMNLEFTDSRRVTATTWGTASGIVGGSCVHGGRVFRAAQ